MGNTWVKKGARADRNIKEEKWMNVIVFTSHILCAPPVFANTTIQTDVFEGSDLQQLESFLQLQKEEVRRGSVKSKKSA